MNLELVRETYTLKSIIGRLSIEGVFNCYALEGASVAIPEGSYEIAVNFSNRFKRLMPLLLNVPGREGIRIHPGNISENTEGCILVGKTRSEDFVGLSRLAYDALFPLISGAVMVEKVFIEIGRAK